MNMIYFSNQKIIRFRKSREINFRSEQVQIKIFVCTEKTFNNIQK